MVLAFFTAFTSAGTQTISANAAAEGEDGLSVTVTPERVKPGGTFTLNITDDNISNAKFDRYMLFDLPETWTVLVNGYPVSATTPEPLIYTLTRAAVENGQISIKPPPTYEGTLTGVTLARVRQSPNLITDFDGGTFDYLGQDKPRLPAGSTQYGYHDPHVLYTKLPACTSPQYGPCDGDYTIWPTANINGPAPHFNNRWADLRSVDDPMTYPTTDQVCTAWNDQNPDGTALNTVQISSSDSRNSGKIAIFNGSVDMPVPNDLLVTTVSGLNPNYLYTLGAYVADISDDSKTTKPVQTAAYVKTSVNDEGTLIGRSGTLPKQSGCHTGETRWVQSRGIVRPGASGQLILSLRNFAPGGFGNDVAIDNMTLYPMAVVKFDLKVSSDEPSMHVTKSSNPTSGSQVRPGQTVTYTVTAKNTGNTNLNPATVTDNLTPLLQHAIFDEDSVTATIDGQTAAAPVFNGQTLKWTGSLAQDQTLTMTYQVQVKNDVSAGVSIKNMITGVGRNPDEPGEDVPSNCAVGTEPGCSTTLHTAVPGLDVRKESNPPAGSQVVPGQTITYTLTANNTGNTDLDPVTLTDNMSDVLNNAWLLRDSIDANRGDPPKVTNGTLTWQGELKEGQSVTITYQVTVKTTAASGTLLRNHVIGHGEDPDEPGVDVPSGCQTGDEDGCTTDHHVGLPGLTVVKTSNPPSGSRVALGDTITYTLTATNTGETRLDVTLTDDLTQVMPHVQFQDGSLEAKINGTAASPPTRNNMTLTWTGALEPGQVATVSYQVVVSEFELNDLIVNKVIGKGKTPGDPGVDVPSNCVTGEEPGCTTTLKPSRAELKVEKSSDPASGSMVRAGQVITYTIKATNTGNTDLDPVTLTDNISDILQHTRLDRDSMTAHVDNQPAGDLQEFNSMLTWTGKLAPGKVVTITYQVTVKADVTQNDRIVNHVTGTGFVPGDPDNPDDPDTTIESNCVTGNEPECTTTHTPGVPGLDITKTSNPASGSQVRAGQTITYTLTATNTGNTLLDPVTLTDNMSGMSSYTTLVPDSIKATIDGHAAAAPTRTNSTLTWQGALEPGQVAVVTYQVTVNQDVTSANLITNKVTGTGNHPGDPDDPDVPDTPVTSNCVTGEEPECTTTVTPGVPGLHVTKTSDPASGSQIHAGKTITYTLTATNTGNTVLDPVTLTDNMSGMSAYTTPVAGSLQATIDGSPAASPTRTDNTLTWQGALEPGQVAVVTYQVTVNQDVTSANLITNKVTGTGNHPGDPDDPDVPDTPVTSNCVTGEEPECTTTLTPGIPGLNVKKTSNPPSGTQVRAGQTITYMLTATNTGNTPLDVIVSDNLTEALLHTKLDQTSISATIDGNPAAMLTRTGDTLTWQGVLEPDQVAVITYQVVVDPDVVPTDLIDNRVTGVGHDPNDPDDDVTPDCVEGDDPECSTTHTPGVPGLDVKKTSNPASGSQVRAGQTITYTLTATNTGNTLLDPVTLTDNMSGMSAYTTPVAGSLKATIDGSPVASPTRAGDTLTWQGALEPGQVAVVTYQVTVNQDVTSANLITNKVTGTGNHPGDPDDPDVPDTPVTSNCVTGEEPECTTTLTPGIPGLNVKKTSNPPSGTQVRAGQTITYMLTATNTGNTPLDVIVSDNLTEALLHTKLDQTSISATIDGNPAAMLTRTGDTLTWQGVLEPDQVAVITYQVVVDPDVVPTDLIDNRVTGVGHDPNDPDDDVTPDCVEGDDPECSTTHTPGVPGLDIKKTSNPASGSQVRAGQTITYTLTATNTGNTLLDPVTLTDNMSGMSAYTTPVAGSLQATIDGSPVASPTRMGDTLTWQGALEPGQVAVVTYQVTVKQDVTSANLITNKVTGTGNYPGDPDDPDVPDTPVTSNCVTGEEPECTTTVTPGVPGLHVKKTSDPASGSRIYPGKTITYTLTATNTGNTVLDPVTLTDDMSKALNNTTLVQESLQATIDGNPAAAPTRAEETLTWQGILNPGQVAVVTYQVVVNADVTSANLITNQVIGTGNYPGEPGDPENPDDPGVPDQPITSNCVTGEEPECTTTLTPAQPGLAITKHSDPSSGSRIYPGQTVTYTLTATNTGNTVLNPVTITDDLSQVFMHARLVPGSMSTLVAGQPAPAPYLQGQTLVWQGELTPGQVAIITYQVTVNLDVKATDVFVNVVFGVGEDPDNPGTDVPSNCIEGEDPECSSTLTPSVPGLRINKSSNPPSGSQVRSGQIITYTLTATNTGNTDLDPVTLVDNMTTVLKHTELKKDSIQANIDGTPAARPTLVGTMLGWQGQLTPGQTVTITYQVVVNAKLASGDLIQNQVKGTGENPDNPGQDVPSTCITGEEPECSSTLVPAIPGLTVTKQSDPASGSRVSAGQVITYTLTAKNTGDVDLRPVTLIDDMSGVAQHTTLSVTSITASINGQPATAPSLNGTTLTWQGDLAPGQFATVTYKVTVNANIAQGFILTNKVTGKGVTPPLPPEPGQPGQPGDDVPSNCVTGDEDGCNTHLTPGDPPRPGVKVQTGGSVQNQVYPALLGAAALMLAGVGLVVHRRQMARRLS